MVTVTLKLGQKGKKCMAKITLTDEEVRVALAKPLTEKCQYVLGEFDPEECYFTVITSSGEVQDVEEILFTGIA